MRPDGIFQILFWILLLSTTAVRLGLTLRHIVHVRRHREQVPFPFRDRIPLTEHQRAADYTIAKSHLRIVTVVLEAVMLAFWTVDGGLASLDGLILDSLGSGWIADLTLAVTVMAVSALVELPLSLYGTFRIEARFGFNHTTLRLFFTDLLRETVLMLILGGPLFLAALGMMNSLGDYWWLWAWLAWMIFTIGLLAIYPVLIAPLFNHFTPLPAGEVRERIEALLARTGFRSSGLFVMDGSRRSSHGNAYFTGLGQSKRVVFFDTLLERLAPAEAEAVLAHELGHYHHRHIAQRIGVQFLVSLAFLGLLGALRLAPGFAAGLGVAKPDSAQLLILFMLVIPLLAFPFQPLTGFFSRLHEFQADAYAARQTSALDLVAALLKLYQDNAATLTPDPWHSAVFDSHPPAPQRIARLIGPTA